MWFAEAIFREDRWIVEREQGAWNSQGRCLIGLGVRILIR
jgi:hypothetical protein